MSNDVCICIFLLAVRGFIVINIRISGIIVIFKLRLLRISAQYYLKNISKLLRILRYRHNEGLFLDASFPNTYKYLKKN